MLLTINQLDMSKRNDRIKKVFIDIEYVDNYDLLKILSELQKDIISGIETKEEKIRSKGVDLDYQFKQWYLKKRDYQEFVENEKTIFVVKSRL
jgi:uncharacterized Fe-S cluster-containing MiaB family protein